MGLTLPLRCLSPSCRKLRKVWVTEIESKPGDRLYIEELISLLLGAKPDPLRTVPTALPHTPPPQWYSVFFHWLSLIFLFDNSSATWHLETLPHLSNTPSHHPIMSEALWYTDNEIVLGSLIRLAVSDWKRNTVWVLLGPTNHHSLRLGQMSVIKCSLNKLKK